MVPRISALFLALLLALAAVPASAQSAPQNYPVVAGCQFLLGFKALHDAMPNVVGACINNEAYGPNGDSVQLTFGVPGTPAPGELVWRKADNWTAYTDGYRTWVNGPDGIQARLNTQRFSWEANPGGLAVIQDTKGPAVPVASAAAPHRYVVLVGGWGSTLGSVDGNFTPLMDQLVQQYGYAPSDFVEFGYAGFTVRADGMPQANSYDRCDTEGDIPAETDLLRRTVRAIIAAHPRATIAVVGHSMGGLLAYTGLNEGLDGSDPAGLTSIVTLDSPLHGIGAGLAFGDLVGCSGQAIDELRSIGASAATPGGLSAIYDRFHAGGVHVATIGNDYDCLYDWALCHPVLGALSNDWRFTQYAPADRSLEYAVGALSATSPVSYEQQMHDAILFSPQVTQAIADGLGHQS